MCSLDSASGTESKITRQHYSSVKLNSLSYTLFGSVVDSPKAWGNLVDLIKQTVWHHWALSLLSHFCLLSEQHLWIVSLVMHIFRHFIIHHAKCLNPKGWQCLIKTYSGLIANFLLLQFFCQQEETSNKIWAIKIWLDDRHKLAPCIWPDYHRWPAESMQTCFFSIIFMWQLQKVLGKQQMFF